MILQKSPNKWSCVACSFAMTLNVTLDDIVQNLMHDGSEILWEDLPTPQSRRAFQVQELVVYAYTLGFSVTRLDFTPASGPDSTHVYTSNHTQFVEQVMRDTPGVLLGKGLQNPHAVAWNGYEVYDPSNGVYTLPSHLFRPTSFLAIEKRL